MKYMSVYILRCADDSYYVGVTNDIDNRLWEHQTGIHLKSYTFKRRPVTLVFVEHFFNADDAIAFEKQVKGWRRAKKEALIQGKWESLPELSISYKEKMTRKLADDGNLRQ